MSYRQGNLSHLAPGPHLRTVRGTAHKEKVRMEGWKEPPSLVKALTAKLPTLEHRLHLDLSQRINVPTI